MSDLLIYKGLCTKSREELREGDKVRIIDDRDIRDRYNYLFPKGTIGEIVKYDPPVRPDDPPYVIRVEARVDGFLDRWWYTLEQVEPVEE